MKLQTKRRYFSYVRIVPPNSSCEVEFMIVWKTLMNDKCTCYTPCTINFVFNCFKEWFAVF